jgi:hypothetical protein
MGLSKHLFTENVDKLWIGRKDGEIDGFRATVDGAV